MSLGRALALAVAREEDGEGVMIVRVCGSAAMWKVGVRWG